MAATPTIEHSPDRLNLARRDSLPSEGAQRPIDGLDKAQGLSLPLNLSTPQITRRRRAQLRSTASRLSGDHPVSKCLKAPREDATGHAYDVGVRVRLTEDGATHASYRGLMRCGGVWCCPDCAASAAAANAEAAGRVLTWARSEGYTLAMVTLTVRHGNEPLRAVWDAVSSGMSGITSGAGWASEKAESHAARVDTWNAAGFDYENGRGRAPRGWSTQTEPARRVGLVEQYGVKGFIKAVECTIGTAGVGGRTSSTWHVHVHLALVLDVPRDEALDRATELGGEIFQRWRRGVSRKGFDATRKGLDVKVEEGARSTLAEYISKGVFGSEAEGLAQLGKSARGMAGEMTLGSMKTVRKSSRRGKNRHPFELLADLRSFEQRGMLSTAAGRRDVAMWSEWVEESRRRRQLQFSDSLKDIARQLDAEAHEEAEEAEAVVVLTIPASQWSLVLAQGDTAGADLLSVVENEGVSAAVEWLRRIGVTARIPEGDIP